MGDVVSDLELVKLALKGYSKQLTTFVEGILARQQLPNWSQLWDDFMGKVKCFACRKFTHYV